jgi:pilus assembly protein CpaF
MKLISIVGAKQGVGASTLAVRVAGHLHRCGEKMCLIDADPCQDIGFILGGAPLRTSDQVLAHRDRLSGDALAGYLHHIKSGFRVLSCAHGVEDIRPLLTAYDTIIVDGLVADADAVWIVSTPDPVMMRAVPLRVQSLCTQLVPKSRMHLVVNAWASHDPQLKTVIGSQDYGIRQIWSEGDVALLATLIQQMQTTASLPTADRARLKQVLLTEFQEKFDLKGDADAFLRQLLAAIPDADRAGIDCPALIKEVLDETLGLGLLEPLMADPSVTEVMINGCAQIYVERAGKLEVHSDTFKSNLQIDQIIERIVTPLGRRVDESSPMVDARLKDGSRVNIVVPPLALAGPTITIRRFSPKRWRLDDLVKMGSLSTEMVTLLQAAIARRLNIIVSGGTGSGKTTLLNVLSDEIPENERIITIEDAAELQLRQPHVVRLESRPPNLEGKGAVTIRDLVKNSLRMRPNRIIVGECRGGEALDMLQAMNTGHDGSLTTIHANSPRAALSRLETLVLFSGMELPVRAIRDQIASAIDVIVQVSRQADGSRKVVQISEVIGQQGDIITLQDLMTYRDGRFVMGSFRPRFMEAAT